MGRVPSHKILRDAGYRFHHTQVWIPEYYYSHLDFIAFEEDITYQMKVNGKTKVFVDHGTGITPSDKFGCHYYLSSSTKAHEYRKSLGINSIYTGTIFQDRTIPRKRDPKLLVYVPYHNIIGNNGVQNDYYPLRRNELEELCKEHQCDDFVTSLTEETEEQYYSNIVRSHRMDYVGHYNKCRWLYENAKVVISRYPGTFDITARSHGIKVIGNDEDDVTLVDGQCCVRILQALDMILSGLYPSEEWEPERE